MSSLPPQLITIKETCHVIGYKDSKVRQLIRDGELQTVGVGRALRVVVASISAFIERNASPSLSRITTAAPPVERPKTIKRQIRIPKGRNPPYHIPKGRKSPYQLDEATLEHLTRVKILPKLPLNLD
jgi:excisionase family DNA binding protein